MLRKGPARIAFPPPPSLNQFAEIMVAAARALEAKQAGLYTDRWHEAQQLADEQTRAEFARREGATKEETAKKRREFERALLESERKARLGIR